MKIDRISHNLLPIVFTCAQVNLVKPRLNVSIQPTKVNKSLTNSEMPCASNDGLGLGNIVKLLEGFRATVQACDEGIGRGDILGLDMSH